jgi:hypothetical protein
LAFHNLSRDFRLSTARAAGGVLIPPERFASSHSTPACSVFQKPAFFPKWKASHGCCASLPIDGRDRLLRETVFAVPAFLIMRAFSCRSTMPISPSQKQR